MANRPLLHARPVDLLKVVATSAEMLIVMPLPLDLLAFGVTEVREQQPHTHTTDERVPLARSGRIAGRFWRRSKAEQAALAYRELGYAVEISEEPPVRSFRDRGLYAVVVFGKTV